MELPENRLSSQEEIPQEITVFTSQQRLLLLGALAMGILFQMVSFSYSAWLYAVLWLAAAAVFTCFNWKRLRNSRLSAAVLVSGVLVCLLQILHDRNENHILFAYNQLLIPIIMMLYGVSCTCEIPLQREGILAGGVMRGFFVLPFTAVPKCFRAFGSLFNKKRGSSARSILAGLAVGIPLCACVLGLLVSADDMMHQLLSNIRLDVNVGEIAFRTAITLGSMLLMYSLFYNLTWGKARIEKPFSPGKWPQGALIVVLALLITVYAVFSWVQFTYLFGGSLPAEYTYSQYARKGFAELMTVAAINFTVFSLMVRYGGVSKAVTALLGVLLAATALLLTSAGMRLLLYIGAYGLTFNRIIPLWLMVFLAFLTVLCAVRLFKNKTPALRIASLTFLYWFVVLNIPNWENVIGAYNAMLP